MPVVLKHGVFVPSYHPVKENPALAYRYDIELAKWLDQLGYDEIWYGEHHSGGLEILNSPELMIAAASQVTSRIKLGTGVVSLPYHNPLMAANRIIQLDHMTMGRVMMGVGPGLLPVDAMMLGIDVSKQRDMMNESLEVVLRLFRGESVTAKSSWFDLHDARLHVLPYTKPYPEVVVASSVTPSGGMTAGRLGLSMLCVAATDASGFEALKSNWDTANKVAAENGNRMDPQQLRLVVPMHIAETRAKARENVKWGIDDWILYFERQAPKGYGGGMDTDALIKEGRVVIGTPDDAIAMIERLQAKQGEFGVVLITQTNWADWDADRKSYELYARYVMPHFAKTNIVREDSFTRAQELNAKVDKARMAGIQAAFDKSEKYKGGGKKG